MDLEPKPMANTHGSMTEKDWVYTPANLTVLSSVKSIKPVNKSVPAKIKVPGYITYDERRINSISSKVGGRIEKLFVKYNFQTVRKGDALFEVFSHDLQTAQEEFFYIKRNDPANSELISAARKKLQLLGMTETQINNLQKADHVHATTTIYSPYSGFVIEKKKQAEIFKNSGAMENNSGMEAAVPMNQENEKMSLREGAYVDKGESVFTIVNTEMVWAVFEVYSYQLVQIRKNQTIHIKLENTDEMIMGTVDFIEPSYREGSGTSRIRVYLNNKDQNLKTGNLLSGEIEAGDKKGLWVPHSAVYDLGNDKIAFIKRNGAYETRKVTVGYAAGKEIEITGGIAEGEEIAENAQFLIDSESFIKVPKSIKP
jgi:Cu(I)/Ag(I) efflux system membrane fusion protein